MGDLPDCRPWLTEALVSLGGEKDMHAYDALSEAEFKNRCSKALQSSVYGLPLLLQPPLLPLLLMPRTACCFWQLTVFLSVCLLPCTNIF